jgi:hypothetical protein
MSVTWDEPAEKRLRRIGSRATAGAPRGTRLEAAGPRPGRRSEKSGSGSRERSALLVRGSGGWVLAGPRPGSTRRARASRRSEKSGSGSRERSALWFAGRVGGSWPGPVPEARVERARAVAARSRAAGVEREALCWFAGRVGGSWPGPVPEARVERARAVAARFRGLARAAIVKSLGASRVWSHAISRHFDIVRLTIESRRGTLEGTPGCCGRQAPGRV